MFSQLFDEVFIYPSHRDVPQDQVQNIFLVAFKGNTGKNKNSSYQHELL